jgi:CHAT domain-containing protein/uncharacterized glyoxalase superfamily protein PhnB
MEPSENQTLLQLMEQFFNAKTWQEKSQIVTDNPQLLSLKAKSLLIQLRMDSEDEQRKHLLREHQQLLSQCRTEGIEAAFAHRAELDAIFSQLYELNQVRDIRQMPQRIALVQQALSYVSRKTNPQLWAKLQNDLGGSYRQNPLDDRADNVEKAIDCYQQALQVRTFDDMPVDWATTMNNLATAYSDRIRGSRADNLEKAINCYQQALQVTAQPAMLMNWANTMNNLANAYQNRICGERIDNLEKAIDCYQQTLQVRTQKDMPMDWADTMNNLATAYTDRIHGALVDNLERAIDCYQQALQVITQQRMPVKWATTVNNLAIAYQKRICGARADNLEQAIDYYQQALEVITQKAMLVEWAKMMNNLAAAYIERIHGVRADNLEQAIDYVQQALPVITKEAMPVEWARAMNTLGEAYRNRIREVRADNLEIAIDCYQQALQVRTFDNMPGDWATTMNNLATAYSDRIRGVRADNLEQAIDCYQHVLQVKTQNNMPVSWAQTMDNIATVYSDRIHGVQADNLEQAIVYYQQALQVRTQSAMPKEWASTMNNLANAYQNRIRGVRTDNLEMAIDCYQQALQVRTQQAMPVEWASTMNNLANVYQNRIHGTQKDNLEQAIDCYQQALQVKTKLAMPVDWAQTMNNLASAYQNRICGDSADNQKLAIKSYQDALRVFTREVMPHDHRLTQRNLGYLHFDENHWQAAQEAYTAALKTTEILFTIEEGTAEGRQTELAENKELAARAGYCLTKLERFEEAVITVEQGRTRAFSENYNTTLLNLASETDRLAFTDLNQQVKNLEQARHTTSQNHTLPIDTVLAEDLNSVRNQLSAVVETIRQTVPDFMPAGLDFQSVSQLAHRLKQPLVYLLTTSKGSLALVVQPQSMKTEAVWLDDFTEAGLDELLYDREDESIHYLQDIMQEDSQPLQGLLTETVLPQLSQQLINPLVTRLQTLGYSQAILIPMDTLNLLPLHASTDFTFSFAPSARLLQSALNKTQPYADAPLSLLGIGNPTAKGEHSLDYGPVEVAGIAALFPNHQQLCEDAATRETVLPALSDKTHLHFSCHGLFNPTDPPDSGLYLADTDRLTVTDLILGTVNLAKTQMVVLSACQTGITDFTKAPNEVIGFSGAFMQAGVPAIISTLWPVDEISAMLLLQRFYQIYRQDNQPPAIALQQAQHWLRDATAQTLMDFCNQVADSLPTDKQLKYELLADYYGFKEPDNQPYAHPYYWAGFVFSGAGL